MKQDYKAFNRVSGNFFCVGEQMNFCFLLLIWHVLLPEFLGRFVHHQGFILLECSQFFQVSQYPSPYNFSHFHLICLCSHSSCLVYLRILSIQSSAEESIIFFNLLIQLKVFQTSSVVLLAVNSLENRILYHLILPQAPN